MKVIIIGGVAGGASAAARLRRLDETAEIILLERSGYISYANCGLPYYIGGVIREKGALSVQTPESFGGRFRIDVRVKNEAVSIDPKEKTVRIRKLETGEEYVESYDRLLLSPGAKAIRPALPGIGDPRIMTLRTVEDTLAIRDYLEKKKPKRAVVVGGGFIGLETAENLMKEGIAVTLLQRGNQVLPPLDYDMACQVHAYLRGKGLDLRLSRNVTGFLPDGEALTVRMETMGTDAAAAGAARKESIRADFVLMAAGVLPETTLAKEAGLTLGQKGAIVVNEYMQTSDPDIYAVGDAVEIRHFITGRKALTALAGPANRQGRIAADHLLEKNPETEEYVLNYPFKKDLEPEIDLSDCLNESGVPLLIQWDERWGYTEYAGELMGLSGCGPTCLSMACIYFFQDATYTPKYVAEFSEEHGYAVDGNGSAWTLISQGGKELGLDVVEIPLDENRIINNLEVGNLIICVVGPGDFTTSGHFLVLTGYEDGYVKLNDPNSPMRTEQKWELTRVMEQIDNLWVCRLPSE